MLFLCYPQCTTCQKAKAWLEEQGVPYDLRDIKLENPTEEAEQALRSSGYCPVSFEMESPALRTAAQAEALVQRISRRSGNVKVWLGQEAGVAGVSAFLRSVEDAEGRCRALTETS